MCVVCVQFNNEKLTVKEAITALKEIVDTSEEITDEEAVHYAKLEVSLKMLESLDAE